MRRIMRGLCALALVAAGLLAAPAQPARAAVSGQWKVDCKLSHSRTDDPIVFPMLPGASHLHDFFGNIGTDAFSTLATMDGVTSTCAKNDRSAYWAPALYRNGVKVDPSSFIAYYENRAADDVTLKAFPAGFQMVFGNKAATTAGQVDDHIVWACSDSSQLGAHEPPATCASGGIQLRLMWPYCWDGKTLADAGTKHVSFAPGGVCPAAFPVTLPTLRTNIFYPVGTTTGDITFASGSVYSIHADFFNAWDQPTLENLVTTCLNGHQDCGHFTGTSPGRAPEPSPSGSTATASPAPSATPPSTPASAGASASASPSAASSATAAAAGAAVPGNTPSASPTPATADGRHRRWALASTATGPAGLAATGLLAALTAAGAALFLRRRRAR